MKATSRTHEMLQNLQSSLKTVKINIKMDRWTKSGAEHPIPKGRRGSRMFGPDFFGRRWTRQTPRKALKKLGK